MENTHHFLVRVFAGAVVLLGCPLTGSGASSTSVAGTVVSWGTAIWDPIYSKTIKITNAVAVSTGGQHAFALLNDGTVVGWGRNDFGQATPPPDLTNAMAVAAGSLHSVGLRTDGTVTCWGRNEQGESAPLPGLSNVAGIAAGAFHSLALLSNGTVQAWGASDRAFVPTGLSNVVAIAASGHNLALRGDGTVAAWGGVNQWGQNDVPPGLTGVVAVAAGATHSLALKVDGTVVMWGNTNVAAPPISLSNVTAIAAGSWHNLALRADRSLVAWGASTDGALDLPTHHTNLVAIAAGGSAGLAITLQPLILSPPADLALPAGRNATLAVEAISSSALSYQWTHQGADLPGATNTTLTLTNLQTPKAGEYRVVVSNAGGSLPSRAAAVTVQPSPPVIVAGPRSQTAAVGATVSVQVDAIGSEPFFYQWQLNGAPLSHATNAVLILANVGALHQGRYRAVVSNAHGSVTSAAAALTVSYPPVVTTVPTDLMLPAGANLLLQVKANGTGPFHYQWQFGATNIAGATNVSVVLTNLQPSAAGQYSVVVSNLIGVVTNVVSTLTIADSPPGILEQPASQVFELGKDAWLRVLAYGSAPLAYQWWHAGSPISGATNAVLWLTNLQASAAGIYLATVTNALGSTNSAEAVLSIGDPFPGVVDWPSLELVEVARGVTAPTHITHAGDGSQRLFVVEQPGRVRIQQTTNFLTPPFLDITDRVLYGGERGLFSLVFPPEFASKRRVYVNYTRKPDGATTVSRFDLTADTNAADPSSEQVILTVAQPFANHNGGQMAFGPDGFLYIGMGDGGSGGDPLNHAQTPGSLLGKILRIDPESVAAGYRIPSGNPFANDSAFRPEIWALGLRNPWRFSFDRLTGDLYIADVGQNTLEEINLQAASSPGGENYGWRVMEGSRPYIVPAGFDTNLLTRPVAEYGRNLGVSVTGGFVFRGSRSSRMHGIYFYGDFGSGRIWGLKPVGTNWISSELIDTPCAISTFGEDEAGQLYLADYSGGRIFSVQDAEEAHSPVFSPPGGAFSFFQSVTVSCPTPGATIRYTTDGRDPTEWDPAFVQGATLLVDFPQTLKARAFRIGLAPSPVRSAAYSLVVASPTFSPPFGPVTNGTLIAISSATPDAAIRFTVDGSEPGSGSPLYTGPIPLAGDTTLKARGFRPGFSDSSVRSIFFSWAQVATPAFDPPGPAITNGTRVAITSATPGAAIRYTVDGSNPGPESSLYLEPVVLSGNTTVKAFALQNGYRDSDIASVHLPLVDYEPTVVVTLAGGPAAGWRDGTGVAAQFRSPTGLAVDHWGNIYVADSGNHAIRKISRFGDVTTLAGTGTPGGADAIGTNAQFNLPVSVAVDDLGTVFVAEAGGVKLRKITPDGAVTTLRSEWSFPFGQNFWQMELNQDGALFLGSWGSILKIQPSGLPALFAGPGACCPNNWSRSVGVGVDALGNVFAVLTDSGRVLKINPNGQEALVAGNRPGYFRDGDRASAELTAPSDVSVDGAGNLYVSDWSRIRKIRPDGWVSTLAGSGEVGHQDGPGPVARFFEPAGICVDSAGMVYVADSRNHRIRKILPRSRVVELSGRLKYFAGNSPMPGFPLALQGDDAQILSTGTDGGFKISVNDGGNYRIVAGEPAIGDAQSGVTTLDIALMRRHILGIVALDSPYKVLAADVNGSSSVTTLDISLMRRLILGITTNYPGGLLWRFARSDYQFSDPQVPWNAEATRSFSVSDADVLGQDFIGIKLGDVNGSWTAPGVSQQSVEHGASKRVSVMSVRPGASGTQNASEKSFSGSTGDSPVPSGDPPDGMGAATQRNNAGPAEVPLSAIPAGGSPTGAGDSPALPISAAYSPRVKLSARTSPLKTGGTSKVAINARGFKDVTTAQFTLRWDPEVLEFVRTSEHALPGLAAENFGLNLVNEGKLTFSWDDSKGVGLAVADGTQLFTVEFKAKGSEGSVSAVELTDGPTPREVTVGLKEVPVETESGRLAIGGGEGGTIDVSLEPNLSLNLQEGLKLRGKVGDRYRIEYVEALGGRGAWQTLRTVELKSGEETVPLSELTGPTNRFYRSVQLP